MSYIDCLAAEFQIYPNKLLKTFFSNENIKRLKKKINIILTQYNFCPQDSIKTSYLIDCMRPIYKDHSKNQPTNIIRQTKILNKLLLEYIIPEIITNIKSEAAYLRTIDQPLQHLPLPINVGNKGRKTLPSILIYQK